MPSTAAATCTETVVEVADVRLQLRRGGSGEPLLVLHSELGVPGWLQAYQQLAQHDTVYVPSLPGFGQSACPDWMISIRDLAAWVTWFVRDLRLTQPLHVIGSSMGGWIAAEIATMNAAIFKKMILVGAAGVKPEEGEVWDYFVHSNQEAVTQAFYDPAQAPEYAQYYGPDWTPEQEDRRSATARWRRGCSGSRICAATRCRPCCGALPRLPWWCGGARTPSSP
jgi:pimeloyl-ACP methyl ester carboxylesterase